MTRIHLVERNGKLFLVQNGQEVELDPKEAKEWAHLLSADE